MAELALRDFVTNMTPLIRRGKMIIDYIRNNYGSTGVAIFRLAYSFGRMTSLIRSGGVTDRCSIFPAR